MDLIHQTCIEALLEDTGRTDHNIFIACSFLCLANGTLHPIGDKSERRSFVDPFLGDVMSDDKSRRSGWMSTPGVGDIKGLASPHTCAVCFDGLFENFRALR